MTTNDQSTVAAGDATAVGWFFTRNGEQIGPRSRAELKAYLPTIYTDGGLVWHQSLTGWMPIEQSVFNQVPTVPAAPVQQVPLSPPPVLGPVGEPAPADGQPGFWGMLFAFGGRAGRRRYLLYTVLVATIGVSLAMAVLGAAHLPIAGSGAVAVRLVIGLPFVWVTLALTSKRLHDLGMSAWHLLWVGPVDYLPNIVPNGLAQLVVSIPGFAITLWLLFKRGEVGVNAFGPDPLGTSIQMAAASTGAGAWKKHPIRNGVLMGLGAIVLVATAAFGLSEIMDAATPECGDKGVAEKVKQIVASETEGDIAAVLAGGVQNIDFTFQDVRTLSTSEPNNGRTCVVTILAKTKAGAKAIELGELGSKEVTYTVQNVDGQTGRYVVTMIH